MSKLQTRTQRQEQERKKVKLQVTTGGLTSVMGGEQRRAKGFLQERLLQRKQMLKKKQKKLLSKALLQRRRLLVALLIIGVAFVSLAGTKPLAQFFTESGQKQGNNAQPKRLFSAVLSGEACDNYDSTLPAGFEEECFSLKNYSDIRVSSGGKVLGFSVPKSAQETFKVLEKNLEEKGWIKVVSGLDAAASFVKQEGSYTWMYLACITMGDGSSVVVQMT